MHVYMYSYHKVTTFPCLFCSSTLIHPLDGIKCEMLEMTYFVLRGEEKLQVCCSNHGNKNEWEDHIPRPKQGKLDVPRHFFILISRDREQDKGCSHFFPVHPSLQLHLPQLHWPWPVSRMGRKIQMGRRKSHTTYWAHRSAYLCYLTVNI